MKKFINRITSLFSSNSPQDAKNSVCEVTYAKPDKSDAFLSKIPDNGATALLQAIPKNILNLLWIKGGVFSNFNSELKDEPSLIDLSCPVNFSEIPISEKIGYYPSYIKLSPSEKGKYLNWLCNIKQEIDIGYVFIFYYGLERHLLYGDYKNAASIIHQLRNLHKNTSFLAYSTDALFISAFIHKDMSIINDIDLDTVDIHFSIIADLSTKGYITPKQIIKSAKNVNFTNLRYIKMQSEEFEKRLSKELILIQGEPVFEVSADNLTDITKKFQAVIANYSLITDERIATFPDVFSSPSFSSVLYEILQKTYNSIKFKEKNVSQKFSETTADKKSNLHNNDLGFNIKSNAFPEYPNYNFLNNDEYIFLSEFKKALEKENMHSSQITLTRLSSKTFNVDCSYCYIGKIKLYKNDIPDKFAVIKTGSSRASKVFESIEEANSFINSHSENSYSIEFRKGVTDTFYMQYSIGPYNKIHEVFSEDLQEYINTIPRWIKYIKYCKRI